VLTIIGFTYYSVGRATAAPKHGRFAGPASTKPFALTENAQLMPSTAR